MYVRNNVYGMYTTFCYQSHNFIDVRISHVTLHLSVMTQNDDDS